MARIGLPATMAMVLATPTSALAQMDWLSPHLESQRHDNVRRHQQRMQTRQGGDEVSAPRASGQLTMAQRQSAWSRHKTEYRRVLLSRGQPAADRWLDEQILAGR